MSFSLERREIIQRLAELERKIVDCEDFDNICSDDVYSELLQEFNELSTKLKLLDEEVGGE